MQESVENLVTLVEHGALNRQQLTSQLTLLWRNWRAISRNLSRPSIEARRSTSAIPTGFWVRFPGWTIAGSARCH